MKKILLSLLVLFAGVAAFAQTDQTATVWGVRSDGVTDNTGSIQRAIDYISAHGGGTLHFYVGRYLTGAIQLKSNVTIHLAEAAVLVGSTNIYDYKGAPALIWADGAENVAVTGLGYTRVLPVDLSSEFDDPPTKAQLNAAWAARETARLAAEKKRKK